MAYFHTLFTIISAFTTDRLSIFAATKLTFLNVIISVQSLPYNGDENCIGRPNGQYVSGYGCNQTYTHCLYGFAIVKICHREDLVFDVHVATCKERGMTEECYYPTKEYQVMRPAKCTGEPNWCRAEDSCSNSYFCCIDGIPTGKRCPKQFDEYDNASNKCVPSDCLRKDKFAPMRIPSPFDIEEMMDAWTEAAKANSLG